MNYTDYIDDTDYTKGEIGQEEFLEYLEFTNSKFRDVRFDKKYQDVDFIEYLDFLEDGIKYKVISDYNISKTGNIWLELNVETKDYKRDGWLKKTEADQLAIYDVKGKFFYIVYIAHLREFLKDKKFRSYKAKTYDNGLSAEALLLLVPIHTLQMEGIACKIQTLQHMIYNKPNNDIIRLKWQDSLM